MQTKICQSRNSKKTLKLTVQRPQADNLNGIVTWKAAGPSLTEYLKL